MRRPGRLVAGLAQQRLDAPAAASACRVMMARAWPWAVLLHRILLRDMPSSRLASSDMRDWSQGGSQTSSTSTSPTPSTAADRLLDLARHGAGDRAGRARSGSCRRGRRRPRRCRCRRSGRDRRCSPGSPGRRRCSARRSRVLAQASTRRRRARRRRRRRCVGRSRTVPPWSIVHGFAPSLAARCSLAAPSSAAFSVCQARVAHLTRIGYSRTPGSTASLSSRRRLVVAGQPLGR